MAKRLAVKVGEYQRDGETKGEYVKLGVMMDGNNGPYLLMDPSVSIAGCMAKQNALAMKKGEKVRDTVMVSVFDDSQQQGQQQNQQQGGYQQQPQNGYNQAQQGQNQQGGYQQQNQNYNGQ